MRDETPCSSHGLLWLLQSCDSAFPSGAYAHSHGLEELVKAGVVKDLDSLETFLRKQVVEALVLFELPYFGKAHIAAGNGDLDALVAMDTELDSWRIPAELRDAGRRVGSRRLALLNELEGPGLVENFQQQCPRAHQLIVAALEKRFSPAGAAGRAFAYQAVVSGTSASLKLIRIGQTACQRLLYRVLGDLEGEIDKAMAAEIRGVFNPLLEIASLRHAFSDERLFIS